MTTMIWCRSGLRKIVRVSKFPNTIVFIFPVIQWLFFIRSIYSSYVRDNGSL